MEVPQDEDSVNISLESNQDTNIRGSDPSLEKLHKPGDPSHDSICDDENGDNRNFNELSDLPQYFNSQMTFDADQIESIFLNQKS